MLRSSRRSHAFTLLELVIVMMLLSLMAALVVPRLSGFVAGRREDEESRRVVALTRYAREEAISRGVRVSLRLEEEGRVYTVIPADGTGEELQRFECEEGLRLAWPDGAEDAAAEMVFLPDGTLDADSATVLRLMADEQAAVEFSPDALTGLIAARRTPADGE